MTFATRAGAASLAFAALLFACQPSPPPPVPPAPTVTASAPEPATSAAASTVATAAPDTTASTAPEPPPDPFEVELAEFCGSGKGWVTNDGKLFAELLCWSADEPPFGSEAALTLKDVPSLHTSKTVKVSAGASAGERQKALAQMKAIVAEDRWMQLTRYAMTTDDTVEERHFGLGSTVARTGTGEGLTVQFHEPELIVTGEKGKVIHKRKYPAWSPHVTMFGQVCAMFTDLSQVLGSRKLGLLFLTLTSAGTPHFCESFAMDHIVNLPPVK